MNPLSYQYFSSSLRKAVYLKLRSHFIIEGVGISIQRMLSPKLKADLVFNLVIEKVPKTFEFKILLMRQSNSLKMYMKGMSIPEYSNTLALPDLITSSCFLSKTSAH